MINKLKIYNQYFTQNDFFGDLENPDIFNYTNRDSHVCLTAPHSTKTTRSNEVKKSDLYTGPICRLLGEINNVSTIIRNKYTPEKSSLKRFIIDREIADKSFIDIHGMRQDVDFELAVGIGDFSENIYADTLQIIENISKKLHIKYVINHPNYTGKNGLTGRLQAHTKRPNVIQLEWRRDMRDYENYELNVKTKTLPFLSDLIRALNRP